MKLSQRLILSLTLVLLCSCAHSQKKQEFQALKLIQPEQLQQDFNQMISAMQQHPALTVFTSQEEWTKIINEQKALLNVPMSAAQFFDVCAQVIYKIRCGHTGLNLPENFWKDDDRALFPLPVLIINDSLIVIENGSGAIARGTQIKKINGQDFSEILIRLKTYISADGMNTTWKIRRLNQSLNNFISLYFNFNSQYEIDYSTTSQSENTTILSARDSDSFRKESPSINEPLTFTVLSEKQTAVMGVHSFNYYRKDSVKFFRTINDFFEKANANGTQNLILDLRGNTGGDPFCAAHLLSYLADKPFVYYRDTYDWCPNLSKPYPLKAKRFKGNLYVLTDGLCFSTTGHLGSLMKVNNIGTMIGEEMGGTYTCNDSGRWYELKNSDLKLRMARVSFKTTGDSLPRERGVLPDHEVKASVADVLADKDVVMQFALKLVH